MYVLFPYLYTCLNILVLIHDWQNGLHAAMFNQVWLIPHKDQWYPAVKPSLLHYKATTHNVIIPQIHLSHFNVAHKYFILMQRIKIIYVHSCVLSCQTHKRTINSIFSYLHVVQQVLTRYMLVHIYNNWSGPTDLDKQNRIKLALVQLYLQCLLCGKKNSNSKNLKFETNIHTQTKQQHINML